MRGDSSPEGSQGIEISLCSRFIKAFFRYVIKWCLGQHGSDAARDPGLAADDERERYDIVETPIAKKGIQPARFAGSLPPWANSNGSGRAAAIVTRASTIVSGGSSHIATPVKKIEPPHRIDSKKCPVPLIHLGRCASFISELHFDPDWLLRGIGSTRFLVEIHQPTSIHRP
jgi:hypothetical protein